MPSKPPIRVKSRDANEKRRLGASKGAKAKWEAYRNRTHCNEGHELEGNRTKTGHCATCAVESRRRSESRRPDVVCVDCGVTYDVSYRVARQHRNGKWKARCEPCRRRMHVPVTDEHREFWLDGGVNKDLRWDDLLLIAWGLEQWLRD